MKTNHWTRREWLRAAGLSAATLAGGCAGRDMRQRAHHAPGSSKAHSPTAGRTPDTLDLADRGSLALHALTGALDYQNGYELYFVVRFCHNPPVMLHEGTGLPTNNPKFAEAQPMMRVMSGSDYNLDIQQAMMKSMLGNVHDDGLYYSPLERRPWSHEGGLATGGSPKPFANVYGNSRFLLAMMAWAQWDKDPAWAGRIQRLADALVKIAIDRGDYAYYPVGRGVGETFSYTPDGWGETEEPKDGGFGVPMYYSGVVRALTGWYEMAGDRKALTMAGKLANYLRRPFIWNSPAQAKGLDNPSHGHASGHFHAHAAALRGLLAYAIAIQDLDLMLFVRDSYGWLRDFGVARIGWFPEGMDAGQHCESCCIGDMVPLAIRLSETGLGDYWDDVDRYVRNQLVEQQLTDAEQLRQLSAKYPAEPVHPPKESDDHVIERNLGGFVGHGDFTVLPNTWIMHCCTGNGAPALFYAWDSIVQMHGTTATVNLLLNRRSPQLDVHSDLPYQGRVVIHNKQARNLAVRIPAWVNRKQVACAIGSHPLQPAWSGNCILFADLRGGERVSIHFPIQERSEKLVRDQGKEYQARFKGNTVIEISPKDQEVGCRIYQRACYQANEAPEKPAPQYVPTKILKWV